MSQVSHFLLGLLDIFDILGTFAFAISGAVLAIRKKFDLFGVILLAVVTGTAGGMMRDVLLGLTPPAVLLNPRDLIVSISIGCGVFFWNRRTGIRYDALVSLCDAIGLGAFAAIGTAKATTIPVCTVFLAVSTGLLTGVGGGVLRDVLCKEVPFILRKEVYATACLAGSILYYVSYRHIGHLPASYLCFAVTSGIRLASLYLDLNLPRAGLGK